MSDCDDDKNLNESQKKLENRVSSKCAEIVKLYGQQHVNYTAKIGDVSFSPKHDLVQACYDTNADVLIIGSKGIAHSFKEKVSEKLSGTGSVADYCVHNAPCDVLIIKEEHDNTLLK